MVPATVFLPDGGSLFQILGHSSFFYILLLLLCSAELCFPGEKVDRLNENPELSEYFALLVDDMLNGFTVPEYKAGCPDFHP